jgi:hypothetical protein
VRDAREVREVREVREGERSERGERGAGRSIKRIEASGRLILDFNILVFNILLSKI